MTTTAAKAYDAIRQMIMLGAVGGGDRITELDLAAELRISRTPVREALRQLVEDRWLEYLPNRGVKVRQWDKKDVRDNFQVRTILEREAARMAAGNISQEAIGHLGVLNAQLRAMYTLGTIEAVKQMAQLNLEFHKTIWQSSGNGILNEILLKNINVPTMVNTYKHYDAGKALSSFDEHDGMIACFVARDGEKAMRIMEGHLTRAAEIYK